MSVPNHSLPLRCWAEIDLAALERNLKLIRASLPAIRQMADAGARVIVTAGSDDKCQACLQLGADHAINYRTHDFVAEAQRLTDGRGVDVVLDMVAGDYVAGPFPATLEGAVRSGLHAAGLVLESMH